MLAEIRDAGLPEPVREFRFSPKRKFRADFAWVDTDPPLVVEIHGGTHTGGRHTRGYGIKSDSEKINLLALMGFRYLQFTGDMVREGAAINTLKEVFKEEQ